MRPKKFEKMFGDTPNNSLDFKSYDFDSFLFWQGMPDDICCVYFYIDENGKVLYVGQSCNAPDRRWIQHYDAWKVGDLDTYLEDRITKIYWMYCTSDIVDTLEALFIDYFRPLLNKCSGNVNRINNAIYEIWSDKLKQSNDNTICAIYDLCNPDIAMYGVLVHAGENGYEKVMTRYGKYIRFCMESFGLVSNMDFMNYDNTGALSIDVPNKNNILYNYKNFSTIRFVNDFSECENSLLALGGTGDTTFIMPAQNLLKNDITDIPKALLHLSKMCRCPDSVVRLYVYAFNGNYGRLVFIDSRSSKQNYVDVPVEVNLDDTDIPTHVIVRTGESLKIISEPAEQPAACASVG